MIIVVGNGFCDVGERPRQTCERYTVLNHWGRVYCTVECGLFHCLDYRCRYFLHFKFSQLTTQLSTASMVELVERCPTIVITSGSIPEGDTIYIIFFCRRK